MNALEINGLTAGYGGAAVVSEVDICVGEGELVALLGPNGAGKTTTLLAVSGLIPTSAGKVFVRGHDLSGLSAVQRARLGLQHVPEDRSLFGTLTVAETVSIAGGNLRRSGWLTELFPALGPLARRPVAALSGGEQQMLALARALCREPRVLMVDEMSLGLAPKIVSSLFPVLRRVATERGCGVLIVEQHVHLALGAVDRAYVIGAGRVVAEGTAADVRPRIDQLTSTYLGA